MRNAFASELTELAAKDERVVLLSGDIGNQLFDGFKGKAAERFFNCGVAEANLISMGAGMAMCGLRPFAYTITPFITTRCYEQIRVDVCYHNQPVTIVGVGAGLSYASLGATHHSCEDIAIMRALPHMTVLCPADQAETKLAVRAALAHDGPAYIRLGKKGEPRIHEKEPFFQIGKNIKIREGTDVCILACGTILPIALEAAELLTKSSVSVAVFSAPSVKPLDTQCLEEAFSRYKVVASVEEHSIIGGFGAAISEWLTDQRKTFRAKLVRFGTADEFIHHGGEQDHAREFYGLTKEKISEALLSIYSNK